MKTQNLKNQLKALAKLKINGRTLPVLEGVVFKDGYMYATNLEVYMKLKVDEGFDEPVYIPQDMIKKLATNFKDIAIDYFATDKVHLIADGAKIGIALTNPDDLPQQPKLINTTKVLQASKVDIDVMVDCLKYVSKDELRPSMTQVAINQKHIVATDAHRLKFVPVEGEYYGEMLVRPQVIELMSVLGWPQAEIGRIDDQYAYACYGDDEIVWSVVDERYPAWQNVVPETNPIKVEIERKKFIEAIKQGMMFANQTTHQVEFKFNGCAEVMSRDLDYNHEYANKFEGLYRKDGDDIHIGFNGKYLMDILNDVDGDMVEIAMSGSSRPSIINGQILLMPVMLNV
jgi:DNA polymerase-3 subunit beta